MTNYDIDAMRRKNEFAKDIIEHEKRRNIQLGKDEEPWESINIELKDEDFIRIAREAHIRDITFNKMVNIILKDGIKDAQYKSKPQLLNETK